MRMISLPSFCPMPTPTTPRIFMSRDSWRRFTSAADATARSCRLQAITPPRACPPMSAYSHLQVRSGRRWSDEAVLHQGLGLVAGATNQGERIFEELVPALLDPGETLFDGLHADGRRLPGEDVDLVHRRHDVLFVEALLLRDKREFLRGRDAHLVRDGPRPHVQGAPEDAGESERVVHLIGEIGSARRDDPCPGLGRLPGPDLGDRVRDHEEDRVIGHGCHPLFLNHTGPRLRRRDDDVDSLHRLGDAAYAAFAVRHLGELPLLGEFAPCGFDVRPMSPDNSLRIDEDQVRWLRAGRDEDLRGPDVRRPRPDQGDLDVRDLLPDDLEGVDHARHVDRRRALLVIVPDRIVAFLPEPLEDAEAFRLRDVLQVDAPEGGRDELDGLDDFLRIFRRERNRKSVDAAEVLEQEGLAFHDWEARLRADVSQTQDPRAVRDHGHLVPFVRQAPHLLRVRLDLEARLRDPWRVPDRQVVEAPDRDARDDLEFALVVRVVLRGLLLRQVRLAEMLLHVLGSRDP